MARKTNQKTNQELLLDFGSVSPKQKQFLEAKSFFVCYGGARGGGKSHMARLKAVGMALRYPGIRILMVRCHYPELEENIIRPILRWVPGEIYSYNGTSHLMSFDNGSIIKFGHYDGDSAESEYQGAEYDVVFVDEATQLSERAFRYLTTVIRGVNEFPKRFYLTCNPGGVGHRWVKRLFIDRQFEQFPDDPERSENPDDYTFIPATVDDNPWLLEASPMYLRQLAAMPEEMRRAHRYGDWDALGGNYFKGFGAPHLCRPFSIPAHWPLYRSFDYGLDRFSMGWWAVDEDGRCWCLRFFEAKNLVIKEAAAQALSHTLPGEEITATFAPPDMWNRLKDTGQEMAEVFALCGLPLVKASNDRVQGHLLMKNMMQPIPLRDPFVRTLYPGRETLPGLMVFEDLHRLIADIRDIQADENNPSDCAKTPHDPTHAVDMCRAFCVSRRMNAQREPEKLPWWAAAGDGEDAADSYEDYLCGGDASEEFLEF